MIGHGKKSVCQLMRLVTQQRESMVSGYRCIPLTSVLLNRAAREYI